MSRTLQQFISDIPEIYQMIYSHPEWNDVALRDCLPRLKTISTVYDRLSLAVARPLRVLDLGCAQGFYSLSLAEKGANVKGIDFLTQNVALCRALANEHPTFDVTFVEGQIEKFIDQLENNQFDLVIGLSVFHHIVYTHGISKVQQWLTRLLDRVEIALLELALKEESLYWGTAQPDNPVVLFSNNAFYQQIAEYSTHLSTIKRPLYLLSNRWVFLGDFCKPFAYWSKQPHKQAGSAHHGSRRYYFGDDFFCKVYYHANIQNHILDDERKRNWQELHQEINFLSQAPADFPVAQLLSSGEDKWQSWNILTRLPGELLNSKLLALTSTERENVLHQILQQLVSLERAGLYHDDLRTWNILVDRHIKVYIIDYGSISEKKIDCDWPENLLLAFFITLNEIISPSTFHLSYNRPLLFSPLNLPEPYSQWLYTFCQYKPQEWSFTLLLTLFERKSTLSTPLDNCNAIEIWIAACEKWLLQRERYENHLRHRYLQTQDQITSLMYKEIEARFNLLYEDFAARMEQWQELFIAAQAQNHYSYESKFKTRFSQDTYEVQALDNSTLPALSRETLIRHYQNNAYQALELLKLRRENHHLQEYNKVLMKKYSWSLIFPYRYISSQFQLLRQYFVRCFGRNVLFFLQRYPSLKSHTVALLYKIGQYERAKRIYRLVILTFQRDINVNQQTLLAWGLKDPQHRLPPAVNVIFNKLRINNKRF